jgi:hypothetical protein
MPIVGQILDADGRVRAIDYHCVMRADEVTTLGESLRRIDGRLLKPAPNARGRRLWFQGNEPYFDVTLEIDDDGVMHWLELTLRGHSLTLDVERGELKTGITNELEIAESLFPASKTMTPDVDVRRVFVERMIALLEAGLDPALHAAAHAIRAALSERR